MNIQNQNLEITQLLSNILKDFFLCSSKFVTI